MAVESSQQMLRTDLTVTDGLDNGELGKNLQGKLITIISPITPIKVYCCFLIFTVLIANVVALSVALSVTVKKTELVLEKHIYAACPRNWIGFGSKCFYFSEEITNWTSSQNFCLSLEAQLAHLESMEELTFLQRYQSGSDHWIGLNRESSQHVWKWADNTEYNGMFAIRGTGVCAYLTDRGVSTGRSYIDRKWICSKPNSYVHQCQTASGSL